MADEVAHEVVDTIANAINLFEGVKTAYSRSKDISSLPDAFHEVPRKAELVHNTLERVQYCMSNHVYGQKSYQEMKSDVESCKQKAENLRALFRKVVPPSNQSKLDRHREAARDLGRVGENKVETLIAGLLGTCKA